MRVRRPISALTPAPGKHLLVHADSARIRFCPAAGLVLTCPPFFHPKHTSSPHGQSPPIRDLDEFAAWTARILLGASTSLKPNGMLCFVKTDVRYKRTLLPVGFRIADAVSHLGLALRAHWVWQRNKSYSPYAPSTGNIFVFGNRPSPLVSNGLFLGPKVSVQRLPSTSFTPGLFEALLLTLTERNDSVVDPFAGQGSLALAATACGRWSASVEISLAQIRKAEALLCRVPNLEVHRA
jgi:hypothetical protein